MLLVLVPAVVLIAATYYIFLVFNFRSSAGLSTFWGDVTALGQAGSKLGLLLIPDIIFEFISIGISFWGDWINCFLNMSLFIDLAKIGAYWLRDEDFMNAFSASDVVPDIVENIFSSRTFRNWLSTACWLTMLLTLGI